MSVAEVVSGQRRWWVECSAWEQFLPQLPDDSVDLIFGSPPYEKARLYLEDGKAMRIARGTEEWVAWMVDSVRAASRPFGRGGEPWHSIRAS